MRGCTDVLTRTSRVPPNVSFEVDDVESEWQYSQLFDFIHSRYMAGSIADWPRLMRQCYKLSSHLHLHLHFYFHFNSLPLSAWHSTDFVRIVLCCNLTKPELIS